MSIYSTSHAHQKAHDILDRARAGGFVSAPLMRRALVVTGDIPEMSAAESAHCIQPDSEAYAAMDDMGSFCETQAGGEHG